MKLTVYYSVPKFVIRSPKIPGSSFRRPLSPSPPLLLALSPIRPLFRLRSPDFRLRTPDFLPFFPFTDFKLLPTDQLYFQELLNFTFTSDLKIQAMEKHCEHRSNSREIILNDQRIRT
jgi:hypothetical protein